jgi:hypothetical protein
MATSLQVFLDEGGAKQGRPVIGKNSQQFSKGDAVLIDSNGFLALATTTGKQTGWCLEDSTMAADNQTVAQVCPLYTEAEDVEVVLTCATALAQTNVGEYTNYATAATGNFVVSASTSATSGTVAITQIDPFGTGTNTQVVVKVANPSNLSMTAA